MRSGKTGHEDIMYEETVTRTQYRTLAAVAHIPEIDSTD